MKTLIVLSVFLSSFVSVPLPTEPDREPIILRTLVTDTGIDLTLANLQQRETVVRLTDGSGKGQYFTETVRRHNGYSYSFGVDRLPAGRYRLSVRQGRVTREQVIVKSEAGIRCSDWKRIRSRR